MSGKDNGSVPHGPRGKALAYLRGELPRGYRGAAEKTIRDALGTNGSPVKFDYPNGTIAIERAPGKMPDVLIFSDVILTVENYFERIKNLT